MRLISNSGSQRAVDELRTCLGETAQLDLATAELSLFAFSELRELLRQIESCRLILPALRDNDWTLLGSEADRAARNLLLSPWLAKECRDWLTRKVIVREAPGALPQCLISAMHRVAARQPGPVPAIQRTGPGNRRRTDRQVGYGHSQHRRLAKAFQIST